MKKALSILVFIHTAFLAISQQQYPLEWDKYMTGRYIYDFQSYNNKDNKEESQVKEYLTNVARSNLAKQIAVKVKDVARIDKYSLDGRTSTQYDATTEFFTDIELKFAKTESFYNQDSRECYVIAYINKEEAREYYENELHLLYNTIEKSLQLADRYISEGYKPKARNELENILPGISVVEDCLLWLNILGMQQDKLVALHDYITDKKQKFKNIIAELEQGVSIYLICTADMFGSNYYALQDKIKGILSEDACNFVNSKEEADYCITVKSRSREYNIIPFGKGFSYVSYVDANISIDNVIASQQMYENQISVKGVHIKNYTEAARVAYENIAKQLGAIILRSIKK